MKLICFGGEKFTEEEKRKYSKYKIKQIYGSNSDLINLYCSAACVVISSKYEGFCIPIVEAMQLGCPVISSENLTTKEIGSDAIIYFKDNSSEDLYEKINKVLYDTNFRNTYIGKGFDRAKFFSWEKCATETLNIYKSVT